jgi:hypothetical protein
MGFEKGASGNPNGRPKGSKNKYQGTLRSMIADFLDNNFEKVIRDFKKLSPKDRLKFFTDLLPYAVPKPGSSTSTVSINSSNGDGENKTTIEHVVKFEDFSD